MKAALLIGTAGVIALVIGIVLAVTANAGIGPTGFAFYAKQGILRAIDQTYGKGNNPYSVKCQDHPNFRLISDNVTCQIRLKP